MKFISEIIKIADSFFLYDNSFKKPILIFENKGDNKLLNPVYIKQKWIIKYIKGILK
jgi:predicted ABC-type ATPase